ncbi:MAG: hypothetical protein U1F43_31910 [Myxococcota bacterium]
MHVIIRSWRATLGPLVVGRLLVAMSFAAHAAPAPAPGGSGAAPVVPLEPVPCAAIVDGGDPARADAARALVRALAAREPRLEVAPAAGARPEVEFADTLCRHLAEQLPLARADADHGVELAPELGVLRYRDAHALAELAVAQCGFVPELRGEYLSIAAYVALIELRVGNEAGARAVVVSLASRELASGAPDPIGEDLYHPDLVALYRSVLADPGARVPVPARGVDAPVVLLSAPGQPPLLRFRDARQRALAAPIALGALADAMGALSIAAVGISDWERGTDRVGKPSTPHVYATVVRAPASVEAPPALELALGDRPPIAFEARLAQWLGQELARVVAP